MKSKVSAGFTLMEMVTVLVIIALVTAMGLSVALGTIGSTKRAQTENKMDQLEKALMDFRLKYNRLPCPADPALLSSDSKFGLEHSASTYPASPYYCGGSISALENLHGMPGTIPVRTLGLPDEFMYDGWGRKFFYTVSMYATFPNIFSHELAPDSFGHSGVLDTTDANCAIAIKDASGLVSPQGRSFSAIYALISYGPNGHGGYLSNGTRVNAGSTNADEHTNCHCDANAAATAYSNNFVEKDPTEDPTNATNSFDDIVRFKERWQLHSPEDNDNFHGYSGPTLAYGFNGVANGSTVVYKNHCGVWSPVATLDSTGLVTGVGFTPNNAHVLTYSQTGAKAGCNLYKINIDGTMAAGDSTAVPQCPVPDGVAGGNAMALSNNGYLAIAQNSAPYIKFWMLAGDKFTPLQGANEGANNSALSDILPSEPTSVSLSGNGDLLVLSNNNYTHVYTRQNNKFVLLPASVFTPVIPANVKAVALSPDGQYLTAAIDSANSLYLWQIGPNYSFTAAATAVAGMFPTLAGKLTFTDDSQYLTLHSSGGTGVCAYYLYKVSPGGLTKIWSISSGGLGAQACESASAALDRHLFSNINPQNPGFFWQVYDGSGNPTPGVINAQLAAEMTGFPAGSTISAIAIAH